MSAKNTPNGIVCLQPTSSWASSATSQGTANQINLQGALAHTSQCSLRLKGTCPNVAVWWLDEVRVCTPLFPKRGIHWSNVKQWIIIEKQWATHQGLPVASWSSKKNHRSTEIEGRLGRGHSIMGGKSEKGKTMCFYPRRNNARRFEGQLLRHQPTENISRVEILITPPLWIILHLSTLCQGSSAKVWPFTDGIEALCIIGPARVKIT